MFKLIFVKLSIHDDIRVGNQYEIGNDSGCNKIITQDLNTYKSRMFVIAFYG